MWRGDARRLSERSLVDDEGWRVQNHLNVHLINVEVVVVGGLARAERVGLLAATALAPASWGTTYLVTTQLLPDGRPWLAAAVRALPAGLLLMALSRRLPRGVWWLRATVLGLLNVGLFFPLIFMGAYRLPGGVAATIGAVSPLLVALLSWGVLGRRPGAVALGAGVAGVGGVGLLVLTGDARVDGPGVALMLVATALMALGVVLAAKWGRPEGVSMLAMTGWQLTAGGIAITPVMFLVEGLPPVPTGRNLAGFAYLVLVGTALAYVLWFRGIEKLGPESTSFVTLVNPVTATAGGMIVLDQGLTAWQVAGMVVALAAMVIGQRPPRRRAADGPVPVDALAPEPRRTASTLTR
jgi:probable blue pigment (indigoidine) exporter